MFIHTSALNRDDFYSALPKGVTISHFGVSDNSRSHDRKYEIRLSGSSKSSQNGTSFKAATYEEWGEWIAYLYALDPNAKFGQYRNRDHFNELTRHSF